MTRRVVSGRMSVGNVITHWKKIGKNDNSLGLNLAGLPSNSWWWSPIFFRGDSFTVRGMRKSFLYSGFSVGTVGPLPCLLDTTPLLSSSFFTIDCLVYSESRKQFLL